MTEFSLASSFLEARAGGARLVKTVDEHRVENVSNRLALVHPLSVAGIEYDFEVIRGALLTSRNKSDALGRLSGLRHRSEEPVPA